MKRASNMTTNYNQVNENNPGRTRFYSSTKLGKYIVQVYRRKQPTPMQAIADVLGKMNYRMIPRSTDRGWKEYNNGFALKMYYINSIDIMNMLTNPTVRDRNFITTAQFNEDVFSQTKLLIFYIEYKGGRLPHYRITFNYDNYSFDLALLVQMMTSILKLLPNQSKIACEIYVEDRDIIERVSAERRDDMRTQIGQTMVSNLVEWNNNRDSYDKLIDSLVQLNYLANLKFANYNLNYINQDNVNHPMLENIHRVVITVFPPPSMSKQSFMHHLRAKVASSKSSGKPHTLDNLFVQ